ncbi:ATP-binding protein [Embleya sp. NPDC005575]|uniref:ATP-binding protein n=1 Tax=Embleya sp. NPDC005575 TaxID=3156892 RepID=UPI0033BDBCA7
MHPISLKQNFPLTDTSVKLTRDCVRRFCVDRQIPTPAADSAALIATELATNAVRHTQQGATRAEFTLVLTLCGRKLDIAVWDYLPSPCPRLQSLADIALDAQSGRGLALIQSDAAGFTWSRMTSGKLVSAWIEVDTDRPAHAPAGAQTPLF